MKKRIACIAIVVCLLFTFGVTVTVDIIWTFIKQCLWKVIIPVIILSFMLIYPMVKDLKMIHKINTSERRRTVVVSFSISILILIVSIVNVVQTTDIVEYIGNQTNSSKLIENEYVKPEETEIKFPEQKRNLIYIFLESMETTYYSKEDGGLSENDLIPETSKLAKENLNFSDTNQLGGAYTLYGTTWTVAAMSAQTSGVPLKLSIENNSLGEYSVFLEGAHSIGEILEENGYHNFLLLGSDAVFGGRKNLFEQHGNYEIWDFESAIAENRVSEKIWWGYTDDLLFEYAKEKILNLSQQEEPFNFTMLTADTHFQDGYKCNDCEDKWEEQYKNVISCSSKRVGEFVEWIKEQDFYENTTIVIAGDHLTMQTEFFEIEENQEYDKKVVNIIINSAIQAQNTNRIYSTMDLYPTTLAALGAEIQGNKLALGTNLFSDELTLIEKYGLEYVNDELTKTSKFYDNNILVSK